MTTNERSLLRVAFCTLVVALFAKIFFFTPFAESWKTFAAFRVPALPTPGADARNIQAAAYCARQGFPLYGSTPCMVDVAQALAPAVKLPELNYPSIWVRAYGVFRNDSDRFFLGFWRLNALLLALALAALCYRYATWALPVLLFSPVALLAVERGNVDATTFFFAFTPLLSFAAARGAQAFFVGFAGALKIFPAVGWVAFGRFRWPFVSRDVAVGVACAAPLLVMSLLELPQLLAGTVSGATAAYGLPSLPQLPGLEEHRAVAYALMAGVVAAVLCVVAWSRGEGAQRKALETDLAALARADLTVLIVSAAIFVATFLLFASFAYRLIFVMPALLVLARSKATLARLACLNIFVVLWLPWAPGGWLYLNYACYPLALLLTAVLAVALDLSARERVTG